MKYPIYLDYNATTPCTEEVMESMLPFFSIHFGNTASKSHPFGWVAENAVEEAREKIAQLIGAKSKEIIFTSGATEALNLAIKGTFEAFLPGKQHFITCQTEHKAVLDCFEEIEKRGGEVTYLPVDEMGKISIDQLVKAILPTTKAICLMWANNETGIIHPIEEIANLCEDRNLILITDAVQAAGKIPVSTSGIHLMAISSHKLYGPKGIGALYVRHNHELPKPLAQIHGGGHEKGIRSGTLNVPGIVGFGRAAELRMEEMNEEANRLQKLRDRLQEGLLKISGTQLNGSQDNRLPHVCNIAFSGVEGEELLKRVNQKVAVSSGSACTSISPKPSHVLKAMGLDPDLGRASIRFSLGRKTSEDEILQTIDWVEKVVKELRE
ncbi:MAG TPA: IscS subfamily cysteine desulfurase [Algoriphagus sp.]|jgi:cysteine desulfurase|uniref:cysteine desulfurase family protein n=5 Tax=Algoriphagus TaxID=246875 RepID=UPI000C59F4F8|nr:MULTISPECIES: cysteine desulfurase family protein [unclassified Algoriphagus]MAL12012.1 IscS subfamily cysteine desulfurase [Algoriphagus sp.]HAD52515.1 IscS subfamily cysteine desulfurase [Algoriphagus sp.]HAH38582.1 IscS subfamily cysteine desulfurase [Algoriphagus sp.]HAZ24235.1 IscS subfamily cysteine desulfurase [Algoriphagus sp.]HCD87645.1 IscS subfamily cysteine desulfurase [Algoriphagus sp.]|tara:strand:- start:16708 stop:17850 length:1143 start_codon:yes stop_codon:yes gene_type:complete